MKLNMKACDISENYKIVTWAANTTGNQSIDEICELAAYSRDSTFKQFIIPYCDVKPSHWKQHGLREYNTKKLRFLVNIDSEKIVNTKTEIHALKDFLYWLDNLKEQSVDGIILICYDEGNYMQEILLQAIQRYNLKNKFCNIVKGFVNYYDVYQDKYQNDENSCTLHQVSKVLFQQEYNLKRALPAAEMCYRIIAMLYNRDRPSQPTSNKIDINFVDTVKCYMKIPDHILEIQEKKISSTYANNDQTKREQNKKQKNQNQANLKKITETSSNISSTDPKLNQDSVVNNCKKYTIITWAINVTGRRLNDKIFNIAASTTQSNFNEFITPNKFIRRSFYNHNMRIIKDNGMKKLKDLQSQTFVDTKPEITVLQEFLTWLEQVRDNNTESIILVYHEQRKHSIIIFLEALRMHKLLTKFSNIVCGFVNLFQIIENKCKDITTSFTLSNISRILLNKNTFIGDAMARVQICYEIMMAIKGNDHGKSDIHSLNTEKPTEEIYLDIFIEPFISLVTTEERELIKHKVVRKTKTFKPQIVSQEPMHSKAGES